MDYYDLQETRKDLALSYCLSGNEGECIASL